MIRKTIQLIVNGDFYEVNITPWSTLVEVLREDLRFTGTKIGCNQGDCGACTVILDGHTVSSCLILAVECHDRKITTIEGLAQTPSQLHPLQKSFISKGAVQCGFCTSGMILSGKYLLDYNLNPSESEIRRSLSGNLCRCTGYNKIIEAIADVGKNFVPLVDIKKEV